MWLAECTALLSYHSISREDGWHSEWVEHAQHDPKSTSSPSKQAQTSVTRYSVMPPDNGGRKWPITCLMDFKTDSHCKKKRHTWINNCGVLCDLCKLAECIRAEMWPGFARLWAETQKLILSEKEKGKLTLMQLKPFSSLSFCTSKHTWWNPPRYYESSGIAAILNPVLA